MSIYYEFLSRVQQATRRGRITWVRNSEGDFIGSGAVSIIVRQIIPLVVGPTDTIGPQAFEVRVANVMFTAWNGSESCDLIRDVLADGLSEWAEQRKLIAERLNETMLLLD